MKRLIFLSFAFLVIVPALAGCGATPAASPTAGPLLPEPTATTVPATPTPAQPQPTTTPQPTVIPSVAPTATPLPSAGATATSRDCPQPTAGTRLFVNPLGGYCLLYLDSHTAVRGGFDAPQPASVRIFEDSILSDAPQAAILVDDATGEDLLEAARTAQENIREQLGMEVGLVEREVAGQTAYMLTEMLGQELSRSLTLEHDGRCYIFTFHPDDASGSETATALTEFVDLILGSFTFIPVSQTITAADECLHARPDEQLIISEALGVCLLLPSSYVQEVADDNRVIFHSGAGSAADQPQLAVEVTEAGSQTAQMLTDDLIGEMNELTGQPIMVTMYTIGDGNVLVPMVDGAPGHESERLLMFDYNGRQYRLTFTPYDPAQPELSGAMADLVTLVTQSFRFLP